MRQSFDSYVSQNLDASSVVCARRRPSINPKPGGVAGSSNASGTNLWWIQSQAKRDDVLPRLRVSERRAFRRASSSTLALALAFSSSSATFLARYASAAASASAACCFSIFFFKKLERNFEAWIVVPSVASGKVGREGLSARQNQCKRHFKLQLSENMGK